MAAAPERQAVAGAPVAGPSVSVCVPVYNGERYLFDCLQSIRDQSLPDIDVLIVDDCSTDRSLEIAQSFAAADSRFTVHEIGRAHV